MILRLLLFLILLLFAAPCHAEKTPVGTLLDDLLLAFEEPSPEAMDRIGADLASVDDPVAVSVAERWKEIYLDSSFRLYYDGVDDPSLLRIPDPSKHAFIVLGYCLRGGEMEPELVSRCGAAAAIARAYPESVLVCTGGPTGGNNPDRHTEGGLMCAWLTEHGGLSGERVYAEEKALTTAENAVFSFRILQDLQIETVTLVTSGYHMRWALMVFHAVAEQNRLEGFPVEIVGNWCCDVSPALGYDSMNASLAVSQLRSLLVTVP